MDAKTLQERLSHLDVRRICVIKPSALGDVVQSLPILPALRARFPQSRISWVINTELAGLVSGHACLDEVIPFERRGGWSNWWAMCQRLRASRFDLVIDLQGLLRTGLMCLATGAPLRIGLETAREGSGWTCHHLVGDTSRQIPAHRRPWKVIEELGCDERTVRTHIAIPTSDRAWAMEYCARLAGPLLVIQPGTRWETKRWPLSQFAEVARRAMRFLGMSIVVVGSPGERAAAEELVEMVRRIFPRGDIHCLAGQTSLKQLAALLQQARFVLSNDSGPLHLAAGLGVPVVGIYTCTSSVISGPTGSGHELVQTTLPCAASYCKRCPQTGPGYQACFQDVSADRVWQACEQLWHRLSTERPSRNDYVVAST